MSSDDPYSGQHPHGQPPAGGPPSGQPSGQPTPPPAGWQDYEHTAPLGSYPPQSEYPVQPNYPQQGPPTQQYPPQGYPTPPGGQGYPPGPPAQGYGPPQADAQQGGYAFGPFTQPGPGGPGGPGPYPPGQYAPPPAPPPQQRKSRAPLIIIGAVVLALVAATALAFALTRGEPTVVTPPASSAPPSVPTSSGPSSAPPTTAPPAVRPSDAVAGYLSALATGSATVALGYAAEAASGPYLTDAVLADSLKRAPLTAIDVPAVSDQNASTVTARYRLGTQAVTETYGVVKVGDQWKLQDVAKQLDLSLVRSAIPMRVNGVKVSTDVIAVLPGSYAFTTGLKNVSYGSKNVVLITSPYASVNAFTIQTKLTKTGKKAAIAAAKKSYNKCLKSTKLAPKNCPNAATSKYKYSRVTWKQNGKDPFRKARVTLSGTRSQVTINFSLGISGPCTYKGQSGTCTGTYTGTSTASMSALKSRPAVRWN